MEHDHLIILYDDTPSCVVKYNPSEHPGRMPVDVLDWYSKKYAIDRTRLSWFLSPLVEME